MVQAYAKRRFFYGPPITRGRQKHEPINRTAPTIAEPGDVIDLEPKILEHLERLGKVEKFDPDKPVHAAAIKAAAKAAKAAGKAGKGADDPPPAS